MTGCAKRECVLLTRVTQREYDTVLSDATKLGLSMSDIVRLRLSTGRVPEFVIPQNEKVEQHVK